MCDRRGIETPEGVIVDGAVGRDVCHIEKMCTETTNEGTILEKEQQAEWRSG